MDKVGLHLLRYRFLSIMKLTLVKGRISGGWQRILLCTAPTAAM